MDINVWRAPHPECFDARRKQVAAWENSFGAGASVCGKAACKAIVGKIWLKAHGIKALAWHAVNDRMIPASRWDHKLLKFEQF